MITFSIYNIVIVGPNLFGGQKKNVLAVIYNLITIVGGFFGSQALKAS